MSSKENCQVSKKIRTQAKGGEVGGEKCGYQKGDNNTEVYIDDVEICDVISYELSENSNIATLKIEICITGEIEVNLQ